MSNSPVAVIVVPILLAVGSAVALGFAVIQNPTLFDPSTGTLIDSTPREQAQELAIKQGEVTRATYALGEDIFEKLSGFVQKVRSSQRTDIPRSRAFEQTWGTKILMTHATIVSLRSTDVGSLTSKELDDMLLKIRTIQSDRDAMLAAYNTIPSTELLVLAEVVQNSPKTTRTTATVPVVSAPTMKVIQVSFPHVTVECKNMPPNTLFVILDAKTGEQFEQIPGPILVGGGSATVGIIMNKDAPAGTYKVRAVNVGKGDWALDSDTFSILR